MASSSERKTNARAHGDSWLRRRTESQSIGHRGTFEGATGDVPVYNVAQEGLEKELPGVRRRLGVRVELPRRQEDPERGASGLVLLDPGAPAVQRRELRDEGEADARPRHAPVAAAPVEELEDRFPVRARHSGPVVVDGDEHAAVASLDADRDPRPRRRVLDRVREEVPENPLDLRSVDLRVHGAPPDLDRVRVRVELRRGLRGELRDVRRAEGRPQVTVPEAIEVEQVGKKAVELQRLLDEVLDDLVAGALREARTPLLQRDREADDRRQRRAQLV